MTSRSEECAIDMPFTCQDEISNYRISRCLFDGNRCPSQSSSLNSNSADICRICHCEGAPDLPLITPCYCAGSLRYVHQTCLQQWIKSSNIKSCELCKFQFIMQTKVKPFSEWEYLEMSGLERKKLACAMLFHIIAMTCVCWSLYVLIDRTMDEVYKGHLEWPFWTKLIVVGIGFMGGIVFMYIQCRAYFVLCKRWKAYNRVIYVQNAPEKLTSRYAKQNGVAAAAASPESGGGGPSCSFKSSFADSTHHKRGSLHETNCIDIKGVRNLHIFFGGDNQIRVHRNDRMAGETRALAHEEPRRDLGRVASKTADKYGNASLRIQIGGNGGDRSAAGCKNGGSTAAAGEAAKMGGTLRSSECQPMVEAATGGGGEKGDQSVVKLQIKKAEIVIEFGGGGKHGDEPLDAAGRQQTLDCVDGGDVAACSPRRKFSSEEYLDVAEAKYGEKIANETHESPTSKLLVSHRNCKVPFNNFFKERTSLKDWKSSEDLLDGRATVSKF